MQIRPVGRVVRCGRTDWQTWRS